MEWEQDYVKWIKKLKAVIGIVAYYLKIGKRMNKDKLIPGKKDQQKRKTVIDGIPREAERWIKCERITDTGAIVSRDFVPEIVLTDREIREEIME